MFIYFNIHDFKIFSIPQWVIEGDSNGWHGCVAKNDEQECPFRTSSGSVVRIHLPVQGQFDPWSRKITHAAERLGPQAAITEASQSGACISHEYSSEKALHSNPESGPACCN